MAFQTHRLVNGEWTTETADVYTALQNDRQETSTTIRDLDIERAPTLGLLTQTVVPSPLIHWILPVKLRNSEKDDVAFIGDDFVQIKELKDDKQLWDVARQENFGARIRNARVIGSMEDFLREQADDIAIKDEDEDVPMGNGHAESKSSLSPQAIVLQLDTGDSVFLMLRRLESGGLEFVSSRHRLPKPMLRMQPGMHLTVDPSSRYVAIGCSEHLFAIYATHPRIELSRQHKQGLPLRHVEAECYFTVPGIILKMEFLFPSPGDDGHIILLVIVVVKGKTRMMRYEWETGYDLAKVRPRSQRGHPLDKNRQLPLLLIPLAVKSAFILMYDQFMTVCLGILEDCPTYNDFNPVPEPPTGLYHGKGTPLWTAWTRPMRSEPHKKHRDDMYIVREDGVLKFLEIDSDLEEIVQTDMNVGYLSTNCGTALASLDYHSYGSSTGDMLITGGDSCSGGTYLIRARRGPSFIEPIHNWSPSPDFATTHVVEGQAPLNEHERARRRRNVAPRPDKIYACAGKGLNGVITEFRHGFEARLAIEMDYGDTIMEAWVLCPSFDSLDEGHDDSLFLLSLGDRSAVLRLSNDADSVQNLSENETKFDLRYRTITASMHRNFTIQVTEQSILLMNGTHVHIHEKDEIFSVRHEEGMADEALTIDKAVVHEDRVLFTTHLNNSVYLQVLEQRDADDMETDGVSNVEPRTHVRTLGKYSRHVTGLAICRIARGLFAIISEVHEQSIILVFEAIAETKRREVKVPFDYWKDFHLEAFVSIVIAYRLSGTITLLCGTRNGLLVTLDINYDTLQIVRSSCYRLGMSQAIVKRDTQAEELYFVSCDANVFAVTPDQSIGASATGSSSQAWAIQQVWITDAKRPGFQQPEISSIARLSPNISEGLDGSLLMVAGSQLLMTAFSTQPKAIPRHISVGGTPTRILYSHAMDLLIVGAIVDNKTTLLFIDPVTGKDLSAPSEHGNSEPVDYISGLGRTGERIFHLLEWSHTKENKTWDFIIVATSSGRMLIVSVSPETHRQNKVNVTNGNGTEERKIHFFNRHTLKVPGKDPVYSVTSFPEGLLWCSGNKLLCDILNTREKRFEHVAEYELPSPATTISYQDGYVYALTNTHSLEVLKLGPDNAGAMKFTRTHGDQVTRNSLHLASINHSTDRPIHLVSDKHCSVVGLWATQDTKADTLDEVFEAELPHSIVKFRPGRCRPVWDPSWLSDVTNSGASDSRGSGGMIARSTNRSELLGLSIDGSLSQYTVIDMTEWKFLRFFIELAIRSPTVCEFTYKDGIAPREPPTVPPRMMHIDGDILKRCLAQRSLEELLCIGQGSEEAVRLFKKFHELLQALHGGTLDENGEQSAFVQQAYVDLTFYVRPAL